MSRFSTKKTLKRLETENCLLWGGACASKGKWLEKHVHPMAGHKLVYSGLAEYVQDEDGFTIGIKKADREED